MPYNYHRTPCNNGIEYTDNLTDYTINSKTLYCDFHECHVDNIITASRFCTASSWFNLFFLLFFFDLALPVPKTRNY